MLNTDKIEIPNKVLEKLKAYNIEIKDFNTIVKDDELNGNKFSLWTKLKSSVTSYYKFFSTYIKKRVNLVELIYILRPLIYLSLMICFKKKSFVPLIVNLILDLIILKTKRAETTFDGQKSYASEYMYRIGKMTVYFLREPIFSLITKPFIRKLMKILRIPTFIQDLVMLMLSYYTNVYFIL